VWGILECGSPGVWGSNVGLKKTEKKVVGRGGLNLNGKKKKICSSIEGGKRANESGGLKGVEVQRGGTGGEPDRGYTLALRVERKTGPIKGGHPKSQFVG